MKIKPGSPLHVALTFGPHRRAPVGRIALSSGNAVLEYAPEFIAAKLRLNPLVAPAAAGLIHAANPRVFGGLHGIFSDSLPDAWGELLVRRRAEMNGIDYATLTALDKLAIVGNRGPGALTYAPELSDSVAGPLDLDTLAAESADVFEGRASADVLRELERIGGSSGGARPKALVGINERGELLAGDGALPTGFDAWIVKFRSSRSDVVDIGPLEATYAEMARAAGLDVAETTLLPERDGGHGYFATKRFDRMPNGFRIHMTSASALLETPWDVPTIDYIGLLKLTRAITRNQADVERAFDRMVFNVFAHNRDDHAKQHSFLMDEHGAWSLAPSYDLTFSSGPGGEHYMAVAGYAGDDVTTAAIEQVGVTQGIPAGRMRDSIQRVASAIEDFAKIAARFGVTPETQKAVENSLRRGLARFIR